MTLFFSDFKFINKELSECRVCPRDCGANRLMGELGYCKTNAGFNISSICIHKGEEPAISGDKGICNVFFSHCNLQCIYCQNYQISCNNSPVIKSKTINGIINNIIEILKTGINILGFVSPSHNAPQVKEIIVALRNRGFNPVCVWNSNGYDKVETLKMLESFIDVYLPDFKYVNNYDAKEFSDANNYPEVALKAIKEMCFQKGTKLYLDKNNIVERGVIIRHLVLPKKADESIKLLKLIADEIGTKTTISLMSQYHPTENVKNHKLLKKKLLNNDYKKVVEAMNNLGFNNGWIQQPDSSLNYIPDFNREEPFGK
ncbi:MAG: radical SAM protein [Bacteroidetes bacterium CG_4_10_14_3_um_filter_31_20]|nr:4Fe-4S cluster-binding domain-containing protein [Bacteroidota bacterium]PIY07100.1 MAG: radical SAM protein [Bacteroidetes bacterium CG_4_10_14_3_um_filter_31_20]